MTISDPTEEGRILWWAKDATRMLRDHERRLNSIIIPPPRYVEDLGAGSAGFRPFQLFDASTYDGDSPVLKIRVKSSSIRGDLPTGFSEGDDPPYLLTPVGSTGKVWGGLTIDPATGETVENGRFVGIGAEMPEDTDDTFYELIGTYAVVEGVLKVNNDRYGPILATVCRDWFSNPASYSVTFA